MFDWLPDRIARVGATAAAREQGWQFVLGPPASDGAVRRCEDALGLALPPSYRAFLRRWDGASLFRREIRLPDGRTLVGSEIANRGTGDLPSFHGKLKAMVLPDIPSQEVNTPELLSVYCQCREEDQEELAASGSRRAQDLQGTLPSPSPPSVHSAASTSGRAIRYRRDRGANR